MSMPFHCRLNAFGEFTDDHPVGPACWDWFDLLAVHSGTLILKVGGRSRKVVLSAGEAILLHPGVRFAGRVQSGRVRASAHHFEWIDENPWEELSADADGFLRLEGVCSGAIEADIHRLTRWASVPQDTFAARMRSNLLSLVLTQLVCKEPPGDLLPSTDPFASLPEWIGKNLRHGASLQAMAEHLHRSVTHFRRTFRQAFGLSPGAYVRRLRLQEAARFLTETRIPIKQIARRVGYGEPPHFHRAFAREYHVTPGQYRIRHSLKG